MKKPLIHSDLWWFALLALSIFAILSLSSCCPKIGETTITNTITKVDTVYLPDTLTVPQAEAAGTIDLKAICDSIYKGASVIDNLLAKPINNAKSPSIERIRLVKDTTGLFTLTATISAYELTIDSLKQVISRKDSTVTTKTITVNRCERKFHYFAVGYFYLTLILAVIYIVAKNWRFIGK